MRKISIDGASALLNGKRFTRTNTKVLDGVMELYGHKIAWIRQGKIIISNAGWEAVTTKDRLNAILSGLGLGRIFQKDFNWFYKDPAGNITPFNGSMEVKL